MLCHQFSPNLRNKSQQTSVNKKSYLSPHECKTLSFPKCNVRANLMGDRQYSVSNSHTLKRHNAVSVPL